MPPCTESCTECMGRADCGTGAEAAQQRDCYVSRLYECVCVRAAFTVLSSTFKFIYAYAEYLMKI